MIQNWPHRAIGRTVRAGKIEGELLCFTPSQAWIRTGQRVGVVATDELEEVEGAPVRIKTDAYDSLVAHARHLLGDAMGRLDDREPKTIKRLCRALERFRALEFEKEGRG